MARKALDEEQQRVPYYPGSQEKLDRFRQAFPEGVVVEEHGSEAMQTDGYKTQPWLLATGLTPDQAGRLKYQTGAVRVCVVQFLSTQGKCQTKGGNGTKQVKTLDTKLEIIIDCRVIDTLVVRRSWRGKGVSIGRGTHWWASSMCQALLCLAQIHQKSEVAVWCAGRSEA